MAKKPRKKPRREIKKRAVEYKGGCCESCGYDRCLGALTFHHRDPVVKNFNISAVVHAFAISWRNLRRELDRTVLLCANCHYEVHNGVLDGYSI